MWPAKACTAATLLLLTMPAVARADDAATPDAATPKSAETPAATPAPAETPAPIEAAKLEEVEHYRVSINTPGLRLGTIEPVVLDEDAEPVYFASDFFVDLQSRRANLRLAGFDNELALAWDMRAKHLRLRLATGHLGTFFVAIDGDVALRKRPEIDARLIVAIAGQKLELDLPRFSVYARRLYGELDMQLVFPLIQGGF
jgi:hypothetical protein